MTATHHPQTPRGDEGEAGRETGGAEEPARRHGTLEEIGIDQIMSMSAGFRKLTFATNQVN